MKQTAVASLTLAVVCLAGARSFQAAQTPAPAQAAIAPTNSAPNPYQTIENWAKLPAGRTWGSLSAVEIDKDGKSIWVAERCGGNSNCWDTAAGAFSPLDPILKFDENGNLVKSFGQGMFAAPHGIYVDRDGNIWVTDYQDNLRRARGAAADSPLPTPPSKVVGHQIYKFSPDGKLLLTVGKPGGNQPGQTPDPGSFYQPNDVITNAAGDIFVCEGHASTATAGARIIKLDKNGTFIKEWGKRGTGQGEFDQPHSFAFDSKGRLFIADRGNNRIQIYDQDGNFLEMGWQQYSRISGLWIDKDDTLFAADSESGGVARDRTNWKRGIRIGSVKDGANGQIRFFVPDPNEQNTGTSAAEGIAVDAKGNIYGAEVGQRALKKYVKK